MSAYKDGETRISFRYRVERIWHRRAFSMSWRQQVATMAWITVRSSASTAGMRALSVPAAVIAFMYIGRRSMWFATFRVV